MQCTNFIVSFTTQQIRNLLLPFNENNTSNYCVNKKGSVVRCDFSDCSLQKEKLVRRELKGINTHGKSMVSELVEVFNKGVTLLGEDGVYKIIEDTYTALQSQTCLRSQAWIKFFSETPLGCLFVQKQPRCLILQMINAYMKKDKEMIPLCLQKLFG